MDSITQALIGVAACQFSVGKRLKKDVWKVGAIAGMAADADILIRSSNHPLWRIEFHRHFTHSIFFIPIGGLLVAGFLLLLFKSLRPKWKYVVIGSLAAYATHGALDCFTSYGTVFFWPLTSKRIALDWISIIDGIFTGALLIGTVSYTVFDSVKALVYACLFCLLYLMFGAYQHNRAYSSIEVAARTQKLTIRHARAMPSVGNLFAWKGAALNDGYIYLYAIRTIPFIKTQNVFIGKYKQFTQAELSPAIKQDPKQFNDFRVFNWFCDGFIASTHDNPLVLADLRYTYSHHPRRSLWGIKLPEKPPTVWVRNIPLSAKKENTIKVHSQ